MSKICSNCGHENRDVAIFCGNCGNRLIATNLTSNLRNTGSSTNDSSTTVDGTSTNSNESGNIFSLCCGVIIILFVIMLIMSMG